MEWKEEYNIGITDIDMQHQKLFELVENIKTNMKKHTNESVVLKEVFVEIIQYTKEHFDYEEKLMKTLHYPGIELQKRQHHDLVVDIKKILVEIKS